ncbi:hypothetical protein FGO68_gene8082 [Halteria grandinella]|uniref:Uncharacterized protein n=1 Tax=Halteria grandinella TaxID=5974 RepID=A0A8J8NC78_HALGN|nr:hypothetical protein FGO68_gene8082 [Halteria grandinella]
MQQHYDWENSIFSKPICTILIRFLYLRFGKVFAAHCILTGSKALYEVIKRKIVLQVDTYIRDYFKIAYYTASLVYSTKHAFHHFKFSKSHHHQ